jgi:hypothetical protein
MEGVAGWIPAAPTNKTIELHWLLAGVPDVSLTLSPRLIIAYKGSQASMKPSAKAIADAADFIFVADR